MGFQKYLHVFSPGMSTSMASTVRLNEDSDVDASMEDVAMPAPRRQRWVMVGVAAGVATAVLLAVVATLAFSGKTPAMASTSGSVQLSQIMVVPPRDECAKIAKKKTDPPPNCIEQKCCQLSAMKCYEIHSGYAKCMKKCTPGKDGTCLIHEHFSPAAKSDVTLSTTNMFCWIFYQGVTGVTVPVYDLELIRTNLFLGTSIFGCESYRVFSDTATWLSPGTVDTVKVE